MVTRLATRTGRYLVPAIAAALLVAACGGGGDGITIGNPAPTGTTLPAPTTTPAPGASGAPATSPPAATTPEQSTPSTDRCHTSEVAVTLGPEDAGAGNRMSAVVLQNISRRTCTVYGYGGLQLLDPAKRPLPNGLTRDPSPAPVLLRVAPGGKVYKDFRFGVVPGAQKCTTPAWVQITPPDETDNHLERWPYGTVCGPVMGRSYQRTSTVVS